MKQMWFVCICAFVVCNVFAAPLPPEVEQASLARGRELSLAVMKRIADGDDRGALELLRPHLPVAKQEFDLSRERTLEKRGAVSARFGKVLGFKLVREEKVSDFLIRITYVEKRANHLLRWQFTFYRPEREWRLNAFNWDDNIAALFDSSPSTP